MLVVVVLALLVRLPNLAGPNYGGDEMFHVLAAQSILANGEPILPSGFDYQRAKPYSHIVAFSTQWLGSDEFANRLPSVLFGILLVATVFVATRISFGLLAAVIASALVALLPMEIAISRQTRVYALFALLYFVGTAFSFRALDQPHAARTGWLGPLRALGVAPYLLLGALGCLLLAGYLHPLAVVGLTGPAVFFAVMCVGSYTFPALSHERLKYSLVLGTGLLGGALVAAYLLYGGGGGSDSQETPLWAQIREGNWRYYRDWLAERYPFVFGALAIAACLTFPKQPKATLFYFLSFAVPFALLSFLFSWKINRYLVHLVPFWLILVGAGTATVISVCVEQLAKQLHSSGLARSVSRAAAWSATAIAALFLLSSLPWLPEASRLYQQNQLSTVGMSHNSWSTVMRFIEQRSSQPTTVLASLPVLARHYGPERATYYHLNNSPILVYREVGITNARGELLSYADGSVVIEDPSMLSSKIRAATDVWFVTERLRYAEGPAYPPAFKQVIEQQLTEVIVPDAPDMIVWRLDSSRQIEPEALQ